MQTVYGIHEDQIRRGGRRLRWLAALGQAVVIAIAVLALLVVYWIQRPASSGGPSIPLLRDVLLTGDIGAYAVYSFAQLAGFYLLLEGIRRLGTSLSGVDPLGTSTLRCLSLLRWGCVVLALLMFMDLTIVGGVDMGATVSGNEWQPPRLGVGFSFWPLYFGVLAMTGIGMLQRIIDQAVVLRMESAAFV